MRRSACGRALLPHPHGDTSSRTGLVAVLRTEPAPPVASVAAALRAARAARAAHGQAGVAVAGGTCAGTLSSGGTNRVWERLTRTGAACRPRSRGRPPLVGAALKSAAAAWRPGAGPYFHSFEAWAILA